jgi:hypothetical protein
MSKYDFSEFLNIQGQNQGTSKNALANLILRKRKNNSQENAPVLAGLKLPFIPSPSKYLTNTRNEKT